MVPSMGCPTRELTEDGDELGEIPTATWLFPGLEPTAKMVSEAIPRPTPSTESEMIAKKISASNPWP
jgi:hypothetical protein